MSFPHFFLLTTKLLIATPHQSHSLSAVGTFCSIFRLSPTSHKLEQIQNDQGSITMSVATTSVKLAGLVFAMALFGMGPGTILLDEFKATWGKKRKDSDKEAAAIVAPPGEVPSQGHTAHLLEGTLNKSSSIRKHGTETLAQEAAQEFVKHPFLPVTTHVNPTEKPTPVVVNNMASSSPTTIVPWLSFMMRTSAEQEQSKK
jgi:hypothetical protein